MEGLPDCALTCLIGAINNSICDLSDVSCICSDTRLNAQLQPCIAGSCTVKESLTAQNFSYSTCQYPASENTTTFPIINIVGVIVAIISTALRVTNRLLAGQVGLDDHTIIGALLVAVAISGVGFPLRTHGLGQNIWTVPFNDISETMKLFFIEEVLYVICISLIKCSMLFLYLRLFPNKPLRLAIHVAIGITAAWAVGSFFAQVFSCSPISFYWNQWDGEHSGRCSSHNDLLLAHAIINIVLDVVVIALPMPILFKLQMSLEKRIGMCLMFAVGIVVTVISVFRLVEAVGFNSTTNPTKDFVPVGVWSLLEIDVGIMCSCMPGIRALCKRLYSTISKKPTGYTYDSRRSKPSTGGSAQNSSQQHSSKSSHGHADSAGQFIRLEEVEAAEDRWPLPDTPPLVPKKDSFGSQQGWHSQYASSPSPTRLKPPALLPRAREPPHPSLVSRKPATLRSNSAHFTWFRDGDSS
ncbi:hypothetical protein BDW62DRAFT_218554 [Aspergillus aurantiobrunneus]